MIKIYNCGAKPYPDPEVSGTRWKFIGDSPSAGVRTSVGAEVMFCNNTRLTFFACQKDAAGAALKKAATALGSGSTLKVAAPEHWA